jgi:hypothetical protein
MPAFKVPQNESLFVLERGQKARGYFVPEIAARLPR